MSELVNYIPGVTTEVFQTSLTITAKILSTFSRILIL